MSRQLTFDLPGRQTWGRDDFFVSPSNAATQAMVDAWQDWPGDMLLLCGPQGSGKTHLARIWADDVDAQVVAASDLTGMNLPGLTCKLALVIEDVDRIAGQPLAETALFHLFNMARAAGQPMLLTARLPPRDWGLTLPDLASRLQSLGQARIEPADDALLSAVLAKLFSDRQIAVTPALIAYLVTRMERSVSAAQILVAELDRRALARGGPVSRADAAAVFETPLDGPGLDRRDAE